MAGTPQVVQVFAGTMSGEEVAGYLEEHYDEDDDDAPLSQFAADFFNGCVDHDFMEFLEAAEPGEAWAAIRRASYSESFLDSAARASRSLGLEGVVCGVFVYDAQVSEGVAPGAVSSAAGFVYVGAFPYERPGDNQARPERTDGHEGRATRIFLTESKIVSGSAEGELRRWRFEGDGRVLDAVAAAGLDGPPMSIIALPSGIAACGNRVVVWPDDGEAWELGDDQGYQILGITLLGDNDTLVASSVKRRLIAWSLSSKAEVGRLETGRYPAKGLRSDGDIIYERDSSGMEHAWRLDDDEPFGSEEIGKERWVECGDRRLRISLTDVVDESDAVVLSHDDKIEDLASDGEFFATACRDGSCRVARPDGQVVAQYTTDMPPEHKVLPWPGESPWGLQSVAILGDIVVAGDASGRVHRFR